LINANIRYLFNKPFRKKFWRCNLSQKLGFPLFMGEHTGTAMATAKKGLLILLILKTAAKIKQARWYIRLWL